MDKDNIVWLDFTRRSSVTPLEEIAPYAAYGLVLRTNDPLTVEFYPNRAKLRCFVRSNVVIERTLIPKDSSEDHVIIEYSGFKLMIVGDNLSRIVDLLWVYDLTFLQVYQDHLWAKPHPGEPVIRSLAWRDTQSEPSIYTEAQFIVFRHPTSPTWLHEIIG